MQFPVFCNNQVYSTVKSTGKWERFAKREFMVDSLFLEEMVGYFVIYVKRMLWQYQEIVFCYLKILYGMLSFEGLLWSKVTER